MDGRILLIIACDEWHAECCACVCVCVYIVVSVKDWYVFTDGAKLVDTKIWTLISLMVRSWLMKKGALISPMVRKFGPLVRFV